ncbi:threonylcarbamoyladenosine tRNA methylthiotransferase MtaB [Hydrogenivirga caldilitoris]|uniref:Threonylcarbamoyladenosine tRNA methylthiotransferase MtaB n=1 Tax=Hydrogenivirga caldilitoris TaxID=246264 RepID=A0A497XQP3_9AQUI|nr:tRNA (N(6)-L-threonylcarbamoyladenosine(37)-C(2))-methylthiotransferase MtaB [Hydrogenivirga caldilitoris]RLJ70601.1 threonylcarbamoyladenosine tRNA methylthiotransferase MtaB [Hydrogenivirga caldilitoris]
MRVSFYTLGCRMNQFDTDLMRSKFIESGYEVVSFEELADIYIVNTCTVTTGGDRSSRQALYQAKRRNPKAVVVATGCYAQVKPQELTSLNEVDLVVGNTHKSEILKLVEEFLEKKNKKAVVGEIFRQNELKNFDTVLYFEESRPFLKVQEGCNKFCTFCVIPFARGKVRSAPKEKVIEQVKLLADRGFEEVVLSGTQLSQYGWDIDSSLHELLLDLLKVEGIKLIRLSSMHIKELSKELIELIATEDRIAPHFHLSLQSGSDRILALMERGYTREDYLRVVNLILESRSESAIGTDIIVGFPTESDKDFEDTYRFVEELPFAYLHVFPYSDRPFTKASKLKGKVQERVKKERVRALNKLDSEKRTEFYRKNLGRKLRATVLGNGKLLTENYISVERSTYAPPGRVVEVTL